MSGPRLPIWTGIVMGLLLGALTGTLLLLVRARNAGPPAYQAATEFPPTAVDTALTVAPPGTTAAANPSFYDPVAGSRRNAIVLATRKVAPAVVSISVTQQHAVTDPRLEFFNRFIPGFTPRRPLVQQTQSYGSGVIVSADGYVVTNAHVIGTPVDILVTLSDGREFHADVVDVVGHFDLAVLKIDGDHLPVAKLADSRDLQIGEWAIAIGSPFGDLLADTQPTVTVGVISAVNRDIVRQNEDGPAYLGMIQTDAAINPGNSGGPLVNALGDVVGINTFIFTETGGSIGIGFAVPSERVNWVLEEIREFGHYREVDWGMALLQLSPTIVRNLHLKDPVGFIVYRIADGSQAWKAGLRKGDIIRTINGVTLDSRDTVTRVTYEATVGDHVPFTAERDGKTFNGIIELKEAP